MFHHPPLDLLDREYPGALFWSGFVGDAIAGSHLRQTPSRTLDAARIEYLKRRVMVRSVRLNRCEDTDFIAEMNDLHIDPASLTYDEQVLFGEGVPKFTAPLVLFDGYEFVTPFINSPWMHFMLSAPNRYRLGQKLMINVACNAFPSLFSVPTTNRLGHCLDTSRARVSATFWLNRARKLLHLWFPRVKWPNFQYNDFNEALRVNVAFRRLIKQCVLDLRDRGVCDWVDFDRIWRRHDRRLQNHGDALVALASLELVLRAMETYRK